MGAKALLVGALLAVGSGATPAAPISAPAPAAVVAPPSVGPAVDVGAIWERRCQNCHGADGRAHTRTGQREGIDDFTDIEWQTANTDEHIRDTISEGSKGNVKMKAFKTLLAPEEIDALISYIRWLGIHGGAAQRASE